MISRQLCTFVVGEHYFGVDVKRVQEVIRQQPMTRVPLAPSVVRGLINLRGQIVSAIDVRRRLELPDRPDQPPLNLVVRNGDSIVSLLVDDIGDVLEVDESSVERPPETLSGAARELVRAVYKLPSRLLMVLDTEQILSAADAKE
jgi:purine-binding chemotaxis protein CheW